MNEPGAPENPPPSLTWANGSRRSPDVSESAGTTAPVVCGNKWRWRRPGNEASHGVCGGGWWCAEPAQLVSARPRGAGGKRSRIGQKLAPACCGEDEGPVLSLDLGL